MRQGKTVKKDRQAAIKKSQKDEGFTLIEVLIAISILAVGLLAVATMQITSIKVNSAAGQITDRITLAQDKLEELMALPYSSPWLEDLGDPPSGTDTNGNTHQETTDGYTISWTVTDDALVSNTKLITVTVTGRGKVTQVSYVKPNL
jgi:prepilin-type N-terminal cleavage/methylation domain-containing protein